MRIALSVFILVAALCSSTAFATAYYAGADTRNDCYSYEQGDSSAACVYSASPDDACAYYGAIMESEGQGYPQYYPYYAEESLNNKCYRANGTQVTTRWFENTTLECTDADQDGQCDTTEEVCSDGYPASADPRGCDRPNLAQCEDGSYVEAGTGICPVYIPPCTDRQTCLEYAKTQITCGQNQIFSSFVYYDPRNMSLSCVDVDPTSADHPDNGGNLDGNPYNDPTSEPEPDDYWYIAQQTGQKVQSEQQAQLADIERVIRDGNNTTSTNAQQLIDTIRSTGNQSHNDSQSVTGAINYGSDRTVSQLGIVIDKLESIRGDASSDAGTEQGILASIRDLLSDIYDKITSLTEIFSPEISESDSDTLGTLVTDHVEGLRDDAEVTLLGKIQEKIDNPDLSAETLYDVQTHIEDFFPTSGPCQPLRIGTPDKPFYIEITCESVAKTRELLSLAIYFVTVISLMHILLSGVTPRVSGGQY